MIPETKAFCPRGLGMVPYLMPSGVELAEATIKAIDQIDVLNKAALIYIASKNMGFKPEGMYDA